MPYPAVATTTPRPRAAPFCARIAGATPTSAEVAGGRGKAHEWHRSPEARAILEAIDAADVRLENPSNNWTSLFSWTSLFDTTEYRPCSEAGWDAYERLGELRKAAVTADLGYTFDDANSPWDEERANRWIDLWGSLPEVTEVVAEELAGRKAGEGRAVS